MTRYRRPQTRHRRCQAVTDVSNTGMESVTTQNGRPIAFESNKLTDAEVKSTTTEQERWSSFIHSTSGDASSKEWKCVKGADSLSRAHEEPLHSVTLKATVLRYQSSAKPTEATEAQQTTRKRTRNHRANLRLRTVTVCSLALPRTVHTAPSPERQTIGSPSVYASPTGVDACIRVRRDAGTSCRMWDVLVPIRTLRLGRT
jgi:hypothetical protein